MPLSVDSGFVDTGFVDTGKTDILASQPCSWFSMERCDTWAKEQATAMKVDAQNLLSKDEGGCDELQLYKSRNERRRKHLQKKNRQKPKGHNSDKKSRMPPTRATHRRYRDELDVALRVFDPITNRYISASGKPVANPKQLRAYGFKALSTFAASKEHKDTVADSTLKALEASVACAGCYSTAVAVSKSQQRKHGAQARCVCCVLKRQCDLHAQQVSRRQQRPQPRKQASPQTLAKWVKDTKARCQRFIERSMKKLYKAGPLIPVITRPDSLNCLHEEYFRRWARLVHDTDHREVVGLGHAQWSTAQIRRADKRGHTLTRHVDQYGNEQVGKCLPTLDFSYYAAHRWDVTLFDRCGLQPRRTFADGPEHIHTRKSLLRTRQSQSFFHSQMYLCAVLLETSGTVVDSDDIFTTDPQYILPLARIDLIDDDGSQYRRYL
eukprot:m.52654 g.52654  ORF g.52654 m.52654 type:complete len:437 (+) comp13517_c0_seq1:39-1349(+)